MSVIGVYDERGVKVPYDKVREHFGAEADMVKLEESYPEALKGIEASPSRLIKPKFFCPYYVYLAKRVPIYVYHMDVWAANRGTIIHAGIKSLPNKERVIKAAFQGKDRIYTVGGVMDGWDERGVLHEVKTTKDVEDLMEPKPEHMYQVRLYKFLADLLKMPMERVVFYYLSSNDRVKFEIPLEPLTAEEVEHDIVWMEFCRDNPVKGPKAGSEWTCAFCDYWRYCRYSRDAIRAKHISEAKMRRPACRDCDHCVSKAMAMTESPRRVCDE